MGITYIQIFSKDWSTSFLNKLKQLIKKFLKTDYPRRQIHRGNRPYRSFQTVPERKGRKPSRKLSGLYLNPSRTTGNGSADPSTLSAMSIGS